MMLHALPPFVEFLGVGAADDVLEVSARGAIAALKPLGERTEIIRIDRKSRESGADLQEHAQRFGGGGLLEVLLGGVAALLQPTAHGLHRPLTGARLGVPF